MEALVLFKVMLIVGLCEAQHHRGSMNADFNRQSPTIQDGGCAYTFIVPQESMPRHSHGSTADLYEISDKLTNIQENIQQLQASLHLESTIRLEKKKPQYPLDCHHAYQLNGSHLVEGVHFIQPEDYPEPFPVYCEVKDDGVWTVIQRRQDGSVDFNNDWTAYKFGFGFVSGEHWLGNEKIFYLLRRGRYKLRVEIQDWENNTAYAEYDFFQIGNEDSKYTLLIGEYSGTAGDSMIYHNGIKFSTKDQDNDPGSRCCACIYNAGWWYKDCFYSNLNGVYIKGGTYSATHSHGVEWYHWRNSHWYSHKKVEMKVFHVTG
ncbi:microfibril-associated glycoprotein 4-like [Ptychodera flava]|uniref:microfibril-associated glycoprotein 4-like n=1 Tax=Ptychodera flava TaxID=63121 RepID=UPI00396A6FF2